MIDLAVSRLQQKLKDSLPFIDLVGGVARAQTINDNGIVKTFPATPDPDKPNNYLWLSPDSNRSAIAYFETLKNQKAQPISGNRWSYEALIRCVVWLNTEKLSTGNNAAAMASVVSVLSGRYEDLPPVVSIRVLPEAEVVRSPDIFGKYSYNEPELQYLMLPYDYFAFDFMLSFILVPDCPGGFLLTTETTC